MSGGRWDRARATGLWLRDTGLGAVGYLLVAVVAVCGWWASFIGLHQFATDRMGLRSGEAWLVPVTFDGAALGLTVCVARASMRGRGALVWRVLVIGFTGLSAGINYAHISDPTGRWVAALLPISAVTVFESLMAEARAAHERRIGRPRPRIHPLRWVVDPGGTWAIVRSRILEVPVPAAPGNESEVSTQSGFTQPGRADTGPDTPSGSRVDTPSDTGPDTRADTGPDTRPAARRTPGRTSRPDTATRIARLRARHPDMTTADIARRVGVDPRTVRRHLASNPTDDNTPGRLALVAGTTDT